MEKRPKLVILQAKKPVNLQLFFTVYGSFILLNEAITIVFGSPCLHALSICLFGIFHTASWT